MSATNIDRSDVHGLAHTADAVGIDARDLAAAADRGDVSAVRLGTSYVFSLATLRRELAELAQRPAGARHARRS